MGDITKVQRRGNVYPHAMLRDASEFALQQAENAANDGQKRYFNCLGAMLFSAFCLEAYLNFLGEKRILNWEIPGDRGVKPERKNPQEKLLLIASEIKYNIEKTSKPFLTFDEIFDFRDSLVHAKPYHYKDEFLVSRPVPKQRKAEWEKKIEFHTAKRFVIDSGEMIIALHRAAGIKGNPFTKLASAEWIMVDQGEL
jgi:hypothetical protein